MLRMNERFGIGSVTRQMGPMLLMLILVFQIALPSMSPDASAATGHAHHLEMTSAASDCPMGLTELGANGRGDADLDNTHENGAHCMPSMCCFHDTMSSSRLVAVGLLLPDAQILDRGTAPSSKDGSTQDRPPRHV